MKARILTVACLFATVTMLSAAVAENEPPAKQNSSQPERQTPETVLADFYRHLKAGETTQAKQLLYMPVRNPMVAPNIDATLKRLADQFEKRGAVHIFDSRILEDLAIVVHGTESEQYTDNIDIEPMVLRRQDGSWKIIFANSADDLKEHELPDDTLWKRAYELLEWYENRETEVRAEWRKRQAEGPEKATEK